jgi:hypothetical protein
MLLSLVKAPLPPDGGSEVIERAGMLGQEAQYFPEANLRTGIIGLLKQCHRSVEDGFRNRCIRGAVANSVCCLAPS